MESTNRTIQTLTIAGSDSGGGAGIQADLKTFQARRVFGMNVIVALTAQNTLGVQKSYPIDTQFIDTQFESLASDFSIKSAKTGMLFDKDHVECVVRNLKRYDFGPIVVDPVMIAKGGHELLSKDAIESIRNLLLPIAEVVTPNIPEAEVLTGMHIQTEKDMIVAAKKIKGLGVKNVIIKGGHKIDTYAKDYVLFADNQSMWISSKRIETKNTHGTGDTFSACLAAELAKGIRIHDAVITSKKFIQGAIGQGIFVGHGHGPTNHWATLDDDVIVEYGVDIFIHNETI